MNTMWYSNYIGGYTGINGLPDNINIPDNEIKVVHTAIHLIRWLLTGKSTNE